MLHDHGQQAVALAPVQCRRIESGCVLCHERTSTPARARCCFKSGMAMLPEWNTLAASAASTSACANTSTKCAMVPAPDRKSTRLNSSHVAISYAVFCLKKNMMLVDQADREV